MTRFEQERVLTRVAGSGPRSPPLSRALAEMVAAYHRCAAIARDDDGDGIMLATIAQLADELADAKGASTASAAARFRDLSFQELGAISSLLNQRGSSGHVRRCHGDLHLGNSVLLSGRPVPFDALEFDERLATIDVLYDLAFLIMDLDFRGDRAAANLVLNSYIGAAPVGGELDGLKCLPLFLATRAAIRAVVASQRARQQPIAKSADDARAAGRYLNAANTYLKPPRPSLVAVGGLSGTGKSTLGAALAPHIGPAPGALHLRSDVERKRHFGVAETERLTAQHYSEAISGTVYRILLEKAESALKAGHAVIIDAVAAKRSERDQMAALAQRTGAVFAGLWLECPFATMVERVAARHGDASDADAAVVAAQSHYDIGKVTWAVIDARGAPADLLEAARTQLRSAGLIP